MITQPYSLTVSDAMMRTIDLAWPDDDTVNVQQFDSIQGSEITDIYLDDIN